MAPKIIVKKFVKLMDHSYGCNSLTNFYTKRAHIMTGIGSYVNLLNGAVSYFLQKLAIMGPDFGRSVNPISTTRFYYAHQTTIPPPDFQTFLRPC